MCRRHFEDLSIGEAHELGSVTVDREEIVAFAERYDPQPIHVDPDAAGGSAYGGVVASGWHTCALCMRRLVEEFLAGTATVGALGVDELRWRTPVRPGDTLSVAAEVVGKEPWEGEADAGVGRVAVTATTQRDETALSYVGLVLFARR